MVLSLHLSFFASFLVDSTDLFKWHFQQASFQHQRDDIAKKEVHSVSCNFDLWIICSQSTHFIFTYAYNFDYSNFYSRRLRQTVPSQLKIKHKQKKLRLRMVFIKCSLIASLKSNLERHSALSYTYALPAATHVNFLFFLNSYSYLECDFNLLK